MLSAVFDAVTGSSSFGDDEDPILQQYAFALSGSAPTELKALERWCRALNLYVNLGDAEGQVHACDALHEMCKAGADSGRTGTLLARACLDQGTLPSIVVVLHANREEPCRAASALLAELCAAGSEQRKAIVQR